MTAATRPRPRFGYRPDPATDIVLRCRRCETLTTRLEADRRSFNTGRCACGGELLRKLKLTPLWYLNTTMPEPHYAC